jgi:hypothetical protein
MKARNARILAMESSPTPIEVVVHYVVGGEDLPMSAARDHQTRMMVLSRAPVAGELLYNPHSHGMDQVLQVAHARDGTIHAFVFPTVPPPYVAQAFGIGDISMPSLIAFEGRTIGEMIAFLAQYPANMEVVFNDRQVLVAKAKSQMIVLRLDGRDE